MTDPYAQGYLAYQEGMDIDENPYDFGDERDNWEAGWVAASAEDTY